MGIIIRQSFKSTLISYIGIAIGMINVLWLMPEFFSPEEVGLFRLLQDIPIMIASFMQFGAANIADRFFPRFKTEDGTNKGFLFLLLTYPLLGYLIFLLTYWIFNTDIAAIYANKSPLFIDYMHFLIPLSLFLMYSSLFETYSRMHLRIVVPTFIREIIFRILFVLLIAGYALQFYSFNFTIILYVISYGLALALLVIYTISTMHFFLKPQLHFLDKPILKNIFSFVAFIIPGSAGSLIASKIDTLIIGAELGLAEIGIYNLAFFIGSVVDMPKRALSQISTPIISNAWNRNDLAEIDTIYKKSAINQALLGGLIFLMIWLNVDTLLALVPKHEIYAQGKYVILFIALGKLADMATGVNSEIILTSKYYKFNLISMIILSILSVITNLIFINMYGINGVALATGLTLVVFNGIKMIFLWLKLGIQPYTSSMVKLISVFVLVWICFSFWNPLTTDSLVYSISLIAIKSVCIALVYVSLIYVLSISQDFNHTFKNIASIIKTFKAESKK
ncbi:polysaccharide biosynthesis C-terminal domain-containing protein [uncultured Cytophaga sp.]|uniref:oligosaccharide flippase family protein n=1 Tax=uncultured Cytophaga sp. TaxID=160238 RepID=UPI00260FD278|nr:polysaccharide biosynthesis C-terminal domain-containing protein [uncultured Cytophaga sp.]